MTIARTFAFCSLSTLACLLASGCASPSYTNSPYHPGPAAGQAVGTGVGLAIGETTGFAVGAGEGVVEGAAAPFDTTTHVVRRWHTETTADGRTIQVPEDILVDSLGRPVAMAPVKYVAPAPAPVATPVAPAPVAPAPATPPATPAVSPNP